MFDNIVGNEQLKETLTRLRTSGRMPNALLFAGPEGVGKRLFAVEIARSLVCRVSENGVPCGECPACVRAGEFEIPKSDAKDDFKRVIFSNHPDVGMVLTHSRIIPVDAIRNLESEAHFRPFEGRGRAFIVDDADKMNDAASNALLKTLEEPAETTHIFLITSRPDSLPPTIRSRCQTLRFAPVPTDEIERYLIETRKLPKPEAALAARLADGGIGRAAGIDVGEFRPRRERMLAVLTDAIDAGDRISLLRIAEEMNDARNKDSFEDNLGILESLIHDVWSLGVGRESSGLINNDIADKLAALAANARHSNMPEWITAIQTLRENLIVNVNRKMATDALFMKMAFRVL